MFPTMTTALAMLRRDMSVCSICVCVFFLLTGKILIKKNLNFRRNLPGLSTMTIPSDFVNNAEMYSPRDFYDIDTSRGVPLVCVCVFCFVLLFYYCNKSCVDGSTRKSLYACGAIRAVANVVGHALALIIQLRVGDGVVSCLMISFFLRVAVTSGVGHIAPIEHFVSQL